MIFQTIFFLSKLDFSRKLSNKTNRPVNELNVHRAVLTTTSSIQFWAPASPQTKQRARTIFRWNLSEVMRSISNVRVTEFIQFLGSAPAITTFAPMASLTFKYSFFKFYISKFPSTSWGKNMIHHRCAKMTSYSTRLLYGASHLIRFLAGMNHVSSVLKNHQVRLSLISSVAMQPQL